MEKRKSKDPYKIIRDRKPCPKVIKTNPYEKSSPEMQQWWWIVFKIMEDKASRPFYRRIGYLEKCFSYSTIHDLVKIGMDISHELPVEIKKEKPNAFLQNTVNCFGTEEWSQIAKRPKVKKQPYSNPYLNFLNKSDTDARIWRPKEEIPADRLPLIEKAKILEEKIATNFDNWFNAISPTKSEIDKKIILSIFEMVFSYPIMTSVLLKTEEMGTVPEMTAKFLGSMKHSDCACVRKEIRRDIHAAQRKSRYVAFNTALPAELQLQRFTEDLKSKWFEYQIRHNDLETMATVWRNITELKTTQGFINWLQMNKRVPMPPYLEQVVADRKNAPKKSDPEIEIDDEEWNITTLHPLDVEEN